MSQWLERVSAVLGTKASPELQGVGPCEGANNGSTEVCGGAFIQVSHEF